MVKRNYNYNAKDEKSIAKAMKSNAPVSVKFATEYARELKGMRVDKAEAFLQRVIDKKDFLPLRKYNREVPHRKGNSKSGTKSGKFPLRTSEVLLELLQNVKANAENKGFDPENLLITHMFASIGYRRMSHQKQGRISGKSHQRKSTHLEIIVTEAK